MKSYAPFRHLFGVYKRSFHILPLFLPFSRFQWSAFASLCWAYGYKLTAYTEHTGTNSVRLLSLRVQIHGVCWAYGYKLLNILALHLRMLRIRLQIECVCWADGYKFIAYAEYKGTTWQRLLSIHVQIDSVSSAYAYNLLRYAKPLKPW
jgi:hypothetical protein